MTVNTLGTAVDQLPDTRFQGGLRHNPRSGEVNLVIERVRRTNLSKGRCQVQYHFSSLCTGGNRIRVGNAAQGYLRTLHFDLISKQAGSRVQNSYRMAISK